MQWQYVYGEEVYPADESEIPGLIESGYMDGETFVYTEGMSDWQPCRLTVLAQYLPPAEETAESDVNEVPAVSETADPEADESEVPDEVQEGSVTDEAEELSVEEKYPAMQNKKKKKLPLMPLALSFAAFAGALFYLNWTIPGLLSAQTVDRLMAGESVLTAPAAETSQPAAEAPAPAEVKPVIAESTPAPAEAQPAVTAKSPFDAGEPVKDPFAVKESTEDPFAVMEAVNKAETAPPPGSPFDIPDAKEPDLFKEAVNANPFDVPTP